MEIIVLWYCMLTHQHFKHSSWLHFRFNYAVMLCVGIRAKTMPQQATHTYHITNTTQFPSLLKRKFKRKSRRMIFLRNECSKYTIVIALLISKHRCHQKTAQPICMDITRNGIRAPFECDRRTRFKYWLSFCSRMKPKKQSNICMK